MKVKILITVVLSLVLAVSARVYSPWIVSEQVPDWSGNWESFKHYKDFEGKTGQDFAIAVFEVFRNKTLGIMHVGGLGEPFINCSATDYSNHMCYKAIRDPVKLMNLSGWGWCGQEGSNMAAAMQQAGVGPTRDRGWDGHGLMEVYYNGGWHYFDADLRGYVTNPSTNMVASAEEAINNDSWVLSDDYNCAVDATYIRDLTMSCNPFIYQRIWTSSHTMDQVLRMGETFTRYWKGDSTRYYNSYDWYWNFPHIGNNILTDVYNGVRKDYGMPSHGRQYAGCNGYWYPTTGMGLLDYQPNLSAAYGDYQDGVYLDSNVTQDNAGVSAVAGENGYVMFDLVSPYIICGKNGTTFADLQTQTNQTEGAVASLTIENGNATVRVSKNNGHTWQTLGSNVTGAQTFDFTHFVYGFWQYIVKIELLNGARLSSYNTHTVVSCAPASLPLANDTIGMQFRTGDRYGFQTKTYLMDLDLHDIAANLPATLTSHTPSSITARATGAVVVVDPPREGKIRWISFGGAFNRGSSPSMEISTDGATYTPVWSVGAFAQCPGGFDCHWELQYDTTIVFTTAGRGTGQDWNRAMVVNAEPPERVWIRYNNNVNMIRAYAHYEEPWRPVKNSPVEVTHATSTGTSVHEFSNTETYANTGLTGINSWVSMAVPSQPGSGIDQVAAVAPGFTVKATPNPFNPTTKIFASGQQITGSGKVLIRIFDIHGHVVHQLQATGGQLSAGVLWDASSFSSGIYIVRVQAGNTIASERISLVK